MVNQLFNKNQIEQTGEPHRMSVLLFFNCCFALVSLCLMFLPIAQGYLAGNYYSILMIGTMGGWFVTAVCVDRRWLSRLLPTAALMILLVLFYAVLVVFGFGNIRGVATAVLPSYYSFFVAYFYYVTGNKRTLATIGIVMFLAFGITMLTTVVGLADNPYLYRESGGIITSLVNLRQNIGLVHHIYSAVLIAALLGCFLKARDITCKPVKIVAWVLFVFCVYIGLTCSSAIALLCAVLVLVYYPLQDKPVVIQVGVVAIALILFLFLADPVAKWIQDISRGIENEYISSKLYDIGRSLLGNSATGEVAARTDRWMIDFSAFLGSYGMGIGPYYTGGGNGTFVITDHSQLFADLGRYGIAFFVFTCILFLSYCKLLKKMLRESGMKCNLNAFYLIFLIMYISQPTMTNYIIPMIFFFFVPASIQIVSRVNTRLGKTQVE